MKIWEILREENQGKSYMIKGESGSLKLKINKIQNFNDMFAIDLHDEKGFICDLTDMFDSRFITAMELIEEV